MHVVVGHRTQIHVPVAALFRVFYMCTWLLVPGRGATFQTPLLSAFMTSTRGFKPRDVDPPASGPHFPRVRPVHVAVGPWTCFSGPLGALFNVLDLCTWKICVLVIAHFRVFGQCTWLYDPKRGSTCLLPPFTAWSTSARGCRSVDVDPRASGLTFPSV